MAQVSAAFALQGLAMAKGGGWLAQGACQDVVVLGWLAQKPCQPVGMGNLVGCQWCFARAMPTEESEGKSHKWHEPCNQWLWGKAVAWVKGGVGFAKDVPTR